jgi:hypothetical protein
MATAKVGIGRTIEEALLAYGPPDLVAASLEGKH